MARIKIIDFMKVIIVDNNNFKCFQLLYWWLEILEVFELLNWLQIIVGSTFDMMKPNVFE